MKKLTITIGIPAYNEEANIGVLLTYLLRQKISAATLKQIVVISDGSTDGTVKVAKAISDKRISVIERKNRLGTNKTQNEIVKKADGEVLIFLNADVVPVNEELIDNLIAPFIEDPTVGIVGGNTAAVPANTLIEWGLNAGHEFKQNLYVKLHGSETLYLCHGRVRAFKKAFYKQLSWPDHCPEDAYSFLRCKELGFRFVFARWGRIYFRSPQTLTEHAKQSLRFHHGPESLMIHFPKEIVEESYRIPKRIILSTMVWYWFMHPVSMSLYIVLTLLTRFFYTKRGLNISKWEIAHTSKKIV